MVQSNMDTAKKIASLLEDAILATGWPGPFIIGSVLCDLCGQIGHVMIAHKLDERPGDRRLYCENCGQKQVEFMDLDEEMPNGW